MALSPVNKSPETRHWPLLKTVQTRAEIDSAVICALRPSQSLYGTVVASDEWETNGGSVAEAAKKIEESSKESSGADAGQTKDRKPLVLMILIIVNSLALLGVGAGLYMYSQETRKALSQQNEIADAPGDGEHGAAHGGGHGEGDKKANAASDEAKMVPLESFIINLNGSEGYKFMKITMSLEVDSTATQEEILKRQAQVRDTIVVLLTSKSYSEVAGENGQQKLKDELIDTVNSFLVKGKIKKILFTDFLFQ